MAGNPLLVLFLFLLTFKPGFSAEISVFVKTGDSVQLDLQTQKLPEFDLLSWRNDKSELIVRYIVDDSKTVKLHSSYNDTVYFNDETFSLTLKNMQKTDSGLYTAITTGASDKSIATYRVSVIDAVDAPVLTVNSRSDSCTVNFTCRTHDLMINSNYQNNRCSPEEVTSQINTLILNCSEESIICNHSNPVSWKKDRINITQLCVKDDHPHAHHSSPQVWIGLGIGCLLAVCLLVGIGLCLYCKSKKGVQEADSTVYAQVEDTTLIAAIEKYANCLIQRLASQLVFKLLITVWQAKGQEMQKTNSDGHTYDVPERVQDQTQKKTGDTRPDTTYSTVGQHQKPTVPVETDHTIYSVVSKQPTTKPPTTSCDDA